MSKSDDDVRMNASISKTLILLLVFFCTFKSTNTSYAHPIFPPEVMEFLKQNPNATKEEINNFMLKTYGNLEELYGPPLYINSPEVIDLLEEKINKDKTIQNITDDARLILSTRDKNRSFLKNARDFTILGVEHILIGLDHILFVISLVLILLPWRKILSMVTTFTIAHSLTLILAGSGILTLSGRIVEPIIAFSIAYMAITTVFLKHITFFQKMHSRLSVIFVFGLFHGLGFAGVFSDLQIPADKYLSSLLFFNVGVEIGQVLILVLVVPLLILLNKNEKLYEITTKIFACIISLLAIYWVVQRVFY